MKRVHLILFALIAMRAVIGLAEEPSTNPVDDPLDLLERKTLYYPRGYEAGDVEAFLHDGGVQLDYITSQGKQTAWLMTPAAGVKVQRLWIVAAGNATLALDMASFCRKTGLKSDAYVLVDYPGYGQCEGRPSPETIRENVRATVLAAADKTGIDVKNKPELVCAFGHSLGCAAALFAVEEFHLKSAVLCSPFTSSREMAELRAGLSKDAPFKQQFDNRLGLKALREARGHAWIIHGADDEIIPVEMSRTLSAEFPEVVKLQVIQDAHHNDILLAARAEILTAMIDAR